MKKRLELYDCARFGEIIFKIRNAVAWTVTKREMMDHFKRDVTNMNYKNSVLEYEEMIKEFLIPEHKGESVDTLSCKDFDLEAFINAIKENPVKYSFTYLGKSLLNGDKNDEN